ncbi:acetate/butyrate--CoA ligase AAE7, peroxisomal-like [Hibiscus syriacus]|uniref:Acetate/butyrate--CoA ligase AAE7, peroxisomal-like n=1 Tax=Hibiscus syriacus TaxID=106335 RepID=A0A6A3AH13_HIBSY|nr:acetate/butyrate--CoA ligase AAE7, peroxisomal-like [Hibiscus syriacus]
MLDPSEKGSDSEDQSYEHQETISPKGAQTQSVFNEQIKKTCADCGTSKTPLWRGGPAGPKSLAMLVGSVAGKEEINHRTKERGREEIKEIIKQPRNFGDNLKQD